MKIKIGQFYRDKVGELYILAMIGYSDVALISLVTGNRYEDKISVRDCEDITEVEWKKITGNCEFIKVDKKKELVNI
jgi:hypothetical protein